MNTNLNIANLLFGSFGQIADPAAATDPNGSPDGFADLLSSLFQAPESQIPTNLLGIPLSGKLNLLGLLQTDQKAMFLPTLSAISTPSAPTEPQVLADDLEIFLTEELSSEASVNQPRTSEVGLVMAAESAAVARPNGPIVESKTADHVALPIDGIVTDSKRAVLAGPVPGGLPMNSQSTPFAVSPVTRQVAITVQPTTEPLVLHVSAVTINGESAVLTAIDKNSGQQLTIKLPTEALDFPVPTIVRPDSRVSVDSDRVRTGVLEQLLLDLNASELDLTLTAASRETNQQLPQVRMEFTARTSEGPVDLVEMVPAADLQLTTQAGSKSPLVGGVGLSMVQSPIKNKLIEAVPAEYDLPQEGTPEALDADGEPIVVASVRPVKESPTGAALAAVSQEQSGEFGGTVPRRIAGVHQDLQSGIDKGVVGHTPGAAIESTQDTSEPVKIDLLPRMVLTPEVRSQLRTSGQSVMIRFEPEHLGPARLRLHISNSGLRAQLTVNTLDSKQLLENNLDRLYQQLHRADIKVDTIEINLGGQATPDQSFASGQGWRRPSASPPTRQRLNAVGAHMTAGGFAPATAVGYVGAAGVNVLA